MTVKKFLFILLFSCIPIGIGISSMYHANSITYKTGAVCNYPMTYKDYCLEKMFKKGIPSEIDLYVLDVCIQEKVNPFEMLSILNNENPEQDPFVDSPNYGFEKIYNKKLKKYYKVKTLLSTDSGLFQLNSKPMTYFIETFWVKCNETETFNVHNYKHNTRMAVRIYKSLRNSVAFKNSGWYYPVMCYNAGYGKVINKKVSKKTSIDYVNKFKENMKKYE